MSPPDLDLPDEAALVLVGGKGGVGKTTVACALALDLADRRPDARVALVSIDPAHSVRDALADGAFPNNLHVEELDATAHYDRFLAEHRDALRAIAMAGTFLDEGHTEALLDLAIPGLDELMAFLVVARWLESGTFDAVLLDTAPTGHTLRFLELPEVLDDWVDTFDAMLAKHRYLRSRFRGDDEPDALDGFLDTLRGWVRLTGELLRDRDRCRFVPVTLAEPVVVAETEVLLARLRELGVPTTTPVLNRWAGDVAPPGCGAIALPVAEVEPRGPDRLRALWAARCTPSGEAVARPFVPWVDVTLPPLPADLDLVLVAGKGGVGKTTTAAATALHLAASGRSVLLASTDPAHSLSAALGVALSSEPTEVAPGLMALEIDAPAELDALETMYREDLENLLTGALPGLDLAFDREVLERLLDLAPPGIDELMGLVRVLELDRGGDHDVVLLDTSPTGHLVRLLEMPALLDQWLKWLFGVLLDNRDLLRLPRLEPWLIRLSRALKAFRKRLSDTERAAVVGVARPTWLAHEETVDLGAALERLDVPLTRLVLNLASTAADSPSTQPPTEEVAVREAFAQSFPDLPTGWIRGGAPPRGVDDLAALGTALWSDRAR